ncbi:hypothetical protein [Isoptericola sp. NPDC058082]
MVGAEPTVERGGTGRREDVAQGVGRADVAARGNQPDVLRAGEPVRERA